MLIKSNSDKFTLPNDEILTEDEPSEIVADNDDAEPLTYNVTVKASDEVNSLILNIILDAIQLFGMITELFKQIIQLSYQIIV